MQKKILPRGFVKSLAEKLNINPGTLAQRISREDHDTILIVNAELKKVVQKRKATMKKHHKAIKQFKENLNLI